MHITEGYGLTEASPVVSVNPTHKEPRLGTIGIPLPSTDVRIVGDDGKDLPLGEAGELAVRGPEGEALRRHTIESWSRWFVGSSSSSVSTPEKRMRASSTRRR